MFELRAAGCPTPGTGLLSGCIVYGIIAAGHDISVHEYTPRGWEADEICLPGSDNGGFLNGFGRMREPGAHAGSHFNSRANFCRCVGDGRPIADAASITHTHR